MRKKCDFLQKHVSNHMGSSSLLNKDYFFNAKKQLNDKLWLP